MTTATATDREVFKGYTEAQLKAAFDLAKDPKDWKAPICVRVLGEAVNQMVAAIQFYTATHPTVRLDVRTMTYVIESEGYRRGPAGDH